MGLRDAAAAQRMFWKSLRQEEIEALDFTSMSVAAHSIAEQLEKRYKKVASRSWESWCQSSLAKGRRKIIQWIAQPERHPQAATQEAPTTKIQRIHQEWLCIWEVPNELVTSQSSSQQEGGSACVPTVTPPPGGFEAVSHETGSAKQGARGDRRDSHETSTCGEVSHETWH